MSRPVNPHDAFFKVSLSQPETALAFLRHYLPAPLADLLDLSWIDVAKDSFVDADLSEHFSDLLYLVRRSAGGQAFVYVLVEHKSHPDPFVALQLLRYMVRIWEKARREGQPLWPILPVVVYHGGGEWSAPQRFQESLDVPDALAAFVPQFDYWLCDLSHFQDGDLRGPPALRVALWALKSIFREDLRERLPALHQLLQELTSEGRGTDSLRPVLGYLVAAADRSKVQKEDLVRLVRGLPGAEGVMPTIADE